MKVVEKGTDRTAKVNFHVQEQVTECLEYDQHVDPTDGALCCYVAVNEGDVIKISGRFQGTTLTAAYDVYVDGVLRKSNNCVSKVVKHQKNFKLDVDTALVHVNHGDTEILDTQMVVAPVSGPDIRKGNGLKTVGTVEVRLYVLRTFGTECPLDRNIVTYLNEAGADAEKDNETDKTRDKSKETQDKDAMPKHQKPKRVTYKSVAPDFMVDFEKNCQEIDRKKANAEKKKLMSKRPDKEPWAIFRFYYRLKETIVRNNFAITYNPKAKGKQKGEEPYFLELEPVPELKIGAKPTKAEEEDSTRAASSPPAREPSLNSGTTQPRRPHTPLAYRRPYVEDATPGGTVIEDLTNKPAVEPKPEPNLEHATAQQSPDPNPAESSPVGPKAGVPAPVKLTESTPATNIRPSAPTGPPAPPAAITTSTPTAALKRPTPSTSDSNANASAKRPRPPPPPITTRSLAETRRKLTATRTRRTEIAKKRAELDVQLEPYRAQMRAEQERLQRELEEETRALKDEVTGLKEDAAMLAEWKKSSGEGEE